MLEIKGEQLASSQDASKQKCMLTEAAGASKTKQELRIVCCSYKTCQHDVSKQSVNKQNTHNKGEQITSSRDASKSKMLVDRSSRSKQDREEELVMHISGK